MYLRISLLFQEIITLKDAYNKPTAEAYRSCFSHEISVINQLNKEKIIYDGRVPLETEIRAHNKYIYNLVVQINKQSSPIRSPSIYLLSILLQ